MVSGRIHTVYRKRSNEIRKSKMSDGSPTSDMEMIVPERLNGLDP